MNKQIFSSALILMLAGCASGDIENMLPDNRPDYKQSKSINKLEIPPNLTATEVGDKLIVPGLDTSASLSDATKKTSANKSTFVEQYQDIHSDGDANWIAIALSPETTWKDIEDYWQTYGITLVRDDKTLGIMETDWLERVGNKPRGSVQKLMDSVFGTKNDDIRDKYKVRMDYDTKSKLTNIFITHAGTTEVALADKSNGLKNKTRDVETYGWINTKRDPNLEIEMLRRISLYLNTNNKTSGKPVVVDAKNKVNSNKLSIETLEGNVPALVIGGNYNQAWILLGIAIDRSHYQIIGQDRKAGMYTFTRTDITESGFIFKSTKQTVTNYQLGLADQGDKQVAILKTVDGKPVTPENAKQILEKISKEIKF